MLTYKVFSFYHSSKKVSERGSFTIKKGFPKKLTQITVNKEETKNNSLRKKTNKSIQKVK